MIVPSKPVGRGNVKPALLSFCYAKLTDGGVKAHSRPRSHSLELKTVSDDGEQMVLRRLMNCA